MGNYGCINRNKKSIERICSSMQEVLEKKEFDEITITELCKNATVARKTFYRNFDAKEDVIKKMIDLKFSEFESTGILKTIENPKELSIKYFEFWYEHKDFLRILYDKNLFNILNYKYDIYMRQIRNLFKGKDAESLEVEYSIKFISGGFWNILQTWVRNDFKESPIEMANLTAIYMTLLKDYIFSN